MNKSIKYLVENILDDFYDNEQTDIMHDYLYQYFPKNKIELIKIIKEHYKNNIYDLNDIDTSKITNFSGLFWLDDSPNHKDFDISRWDVSSGKDFSFMFYMCKNFNCDLSQWVVSNGENFSSMFIGCENFNCDLSQWNVGSGKDFSGMFYFCNNFYIQRSFF